MRLEEETKQAREEKERQEESEEGERKRENEEGEVICRQIYCVEQLGSVVVHVDAANLEMVDDRDSFADPVFLLQQV